MENKKTKIIATVGPASESSEKIKKLILSGVDVFRFNTKHSTVEWHNQRIKKVQEIANEIGKNIGIMVDLQGNELRIETKDEKNIKVKKGSQIMVGKSFFSENVSMIISDDKIFQKIKIGDRILIDDGLLEFKILENKNNHFLAKVIEGGTIKNRKSVNFPGTKTNLSSLIKKDIKNLDSAAKNNVNFVALSFVSSKKDIFILRNEMKKRKMSALIVSKIENEEAIKNIDEIIKESDAIMIARGDLGIEMPIEKLAFWQKEIIVRCRRENKPVIVATQMLHSMTKNKRPTRAEAIDVANSVFDGTDSVMLSEETALGKYPVESAIEMAKILKFNEGKAFFPRIVKNVFGPVEFVVGAIAKELEKKKLTGINKAVVFTESGYTAKALSSFRTNIKIIAITNNKKTAESLSLSYSVIPYHCSSAGFDNLEIPLEIIKDLKKKKLISEKETVAIFHGKYSKKPNLLNLFSLTKII